MQEAAWPIMFEALDEIIAHYERACDNAVAVYCRFSRDRLGVCLRRLLDCSAVRTLVCGPLLDRS